MPDRGSVEPALQIDIFTLFPAMFQGPLSESIVKRAVAAGTVAIGIHDIRDWATDRHRTADDTPYGGGAGMVMKAPPVVEAVESVLGDDLSETRILVMSAAGRRFTQSTAHDLATASRVALICGHYEGIDQRVTGILGAEEVSIGDFVLTGGELPAMVIADTVIRLVPGVIDAASIADESHVDSGAQLVEYPHYTRPVSYRGHAVPPVLLSGHHAQIEEWRRDQARRRTQLLRPDLLPDEE
ncbi:MAG: tRNA (guanosine(37)-N1)-methyltransferase TrmD [Chloroflexia bacterium]|nr:tRNA (guanosine(37)-N1)-methyltransferase TrmD [Chloroflexia bacterium]